MSKNNNSPKFRILVTTVAPTTTTSTSPTPTTTTTTTTQFNCAAIAAVLLGIKTVNGKGGQQNNTGLLPSANFTSGVNNQQGYPAKVTLDGLGAYVDGNKSKKTPLSPIKMKNERNTAIDTLSGSLVSLSSQTGNQLNNVSNIISSAGCGSTPAPVACGAYSAINDALNNFQSSVNAVNDAIKGVKDKAGNVGGNILKNQGANLSAAANALQAAYQALTQAYNDLCP